MTIFIIFMIVWNIVNTFFAFTAFLASYKNHIEIEAIKEWYPFCEIMKMVGVKNDNDV